MKNWIFLVAAIVSEVIATSALKSSEGFSVLIPTIVVISGYLAAFFFLSLVLKSIPVGIAYAIWSGIGIALISLIGWIYYDQRLDLPSIVGICLIMAGVIVINLFGQGEA